MVVMGKHPLFVSVSRMSLARTLGLLLICSSTLHFGAGHDDVQELVNFVQRNGGSQLTIYAREARNKLVPKMEKALFANSVFVKSSAISQGKKFRSSFNIVIVDTVSDLNESMELIGNFTPKSFVLYFSPSASWMSEQLSAFIAGHKLDLLFYTAVHNPGKLLIWSYTFMFKELSKPIINRVTFKSMA